MATPKQINEYISSDFYCAAFVRASGFDLIGVNQSVPRRFNFIFADKPERATLVEDFHAGRALVEPRRFVIAMKELKSLMYADALEH